MYIHKLFYEPSFHLRNLPGQFMGMYNLHHMQMNDGLLGEPSQAQGKQKLEIMRVMLNHSEKVGWLQLGENSATLKLCSPQW